MKHYIEVLKTDWKHNEVAKGLGVVAFGTALLWVLLIFGIIFQTGEVPIIGNGWAIALPIMFTVMSIAHFLARPAVRIAYNQA